MTTIRGLLLFTFSLSALTLVVGILAVATLGDQGSIPLVGVGTVGAALSGTLIYATRRR